jgi:hypothetical protein
MKPISILICIPTVPGRQAYLCNAAIGFATRTPAVEYHFSIVTDAESAGEGWNRCAAQGLEWWPESTFLHFANDDTVCAPGWWPPLYEAIERGCVPCPRIEPAGGHIAGNIFQDHPPMPPGDNFPVPRDKMAYFYADLPENQPTEDWAELNHGNLPTCSREQWESIGPFPPIHYGTDVYFYHRARQLGFPIVARMNSVFYNFNAPQGRHKPGWSEQTALDYDNVFALPKYISGELKPTERDPLWRTPEGERLAANWRKAAFG